MTPARTGLSLLAFGGLMLAITEALTRVDPGTLLGERGPIEIGQLLLLGASALVFMGAARAEGRHSIFTLLALK